MDGFVLEIAGCTFLVESLFESTKAYCAAFLCEQEPECTVRVTRQDLIREQELLNLEADEEGLKRRKFTDPFLERAVIQRSVAEHLLLRDTLMVHGSTVAVDGHAYLFTAACGTGKSTHTRLWREVFGDRAAMVNDDKPFLKLTEKGVFACGSPWTGKHGLGGNVCFPLNGICVLERGAKNVIWSVTSEDVLEMLRHQTFMPECDYLQKKSSILVERLSKEVQLWKMRCNREHDAAWVSYEAMKI